MSYTISNLPKEWEVKKMPDVVKWGSGGTPKATEKAYYENGTIPWLIIGDLNDGIVINSATQITELGLKKSSAKMIPVGTLLVAMYGSIGKLGITGIECCTNQAIAYAKELNGVTTKYMYYYMMLLKPELISMGKGGTQKNISQTVLNSLDVIVPPMEEQERIVSHIEEMLSELDSGKAALLNIKEQLIVYRQAVLKEAFEPDVAWKRCELGDVINVLTDYHSNGSYEMLKEHVTLLDEPDYAIMIRSTNFEKNDFTNDLKYISKDSYDFLKKSQLYGGEVLMGKIGNAGRVYFMKKLDCPVSLAMNLFAMRFDNEIDSKFVYYFLKTSEATADIKQYVKGVGTPTIDKKGVRRIRFRYPNKERQKDIINNIEVRLSACDNIEQTIDTAILQAEAMHQSILKAAFEGRL